MKQVAHVLTWLALSSMVLVGCGPSAPTPTVSPPPPAASATVTPAPAQPTRTTEPAATPTSPLAATLTGAATPSDTATPAATAAAVGEVTQIGQLDPSGQPVGTSPTLSPDFQRLAVIEPFGQQFAVVVNGQAGPAFPEIVPGSLVFSPDSRRLAYVVQSGTQWQVVSDGQTGPAYDGIGTAGVLFSPDSQRIMYVAHKGAKWVVVVDGQEGPPYDDVAGSGPPPAGTVLHDAPAPGPIFSPDSRHVAYIAVSGGQYVEVLDGQAGPGYSYITSAFFSGNSQRFGYVAKKGAQYLSVVDGQESPLYFYLADYNFFSPDGKHQALVVRKADVPQLTVLWDGKQIGAYDEVSQPVFSPDSTRLAFTAAVHGQVFAVVDGQAGPTYPYGSICGAACDRLGNSPIFSPDGRHVAYSVLNGSPSYLVLDGQPSQAYDLISLPVFSADSQHVAVAVRLADKAFVAVDGKPGPGYDDLGALYGSQSYLVFQPGSAQVVYTAQKGKQWLVVASGQEGQPYDLIVGLAFDSAGQLHYLAQSGRAILLVRPAPGASAGAPAPSPTFWPTPTPGAAAFTVGAETATAEPNEGPFTLKIVSDLPMTGASLVQTQAIVNAEQLRLKQAAGQVCGGKYTVLFDAWDDSSVASGQWDPAAEVENANQAAADPHIIAYLGTFNSGAAKLSIPVLDDAGPLVMISPANTYPGLTKPGFAPGEPDIYYPAGGRNYTRLTATDDVQGSVAAHFVHDMLKASTVYVLDDGQLYGQATADAFEKTAGAIGLKVLGHDRFDTTAGDYKALMTKISTSNGGKPPDAIYVGMVIESNAAQLLQDKVAVMGDNSKVKFIGPDGIETQALIDGAGASTAAGVYASVAGLPIAQQPPAAQQFYADYGKAYGPTSGPYAVYGYEAMSVVLQAIENVCAAHGDPTNRKAVRDAVFNLKNFNGALGTWSFDANGDTTLTDTTFYRVTSGQYRPVAVSQAGVITPLK